MKISVFSYTRTDFNLAKSLEGREKGSTPTPHTDNGWYIWIVAYDLWNVHKPIWTGCVLCGAILVLSVYMYMSDSKMLLDEQHTTVDIIQWQDI